MASDGSLKFDTKIDESGFKRGLNGLQKTGTSVMKGIAKATKVVSTAVVALGVAAVKVGADFDEGMSRVGAVSGATDGELKKLRNTAKDLGRTTVFSATQAAEGMEYLAMAGFKTTEIIDAMPGVLNAAAAGNVDLGRAADITSNVLSGFNMTADQSGHIADVLTKTFTSSNTTMESLGDTMKYVAPVANAAGISLEEMAAAAGIMGDAGIQGSQAGMVLRNVILRLADPPKEAADALSQLGVSVTDASGQMKPFPEIIRDLDEATADMDKTQRLAILSQIAGTQSAAGLAAMVEQGGDELARFTEELELAGGTAEEIAAKQLDNLKGDVKLLASALEGAGIAISENFDEALRGSVQFLTEYISQIAFVIEAIDDFEQAMISVAAIVAQMFAEAIQAIAEKVPMVLEIAQQFMVTFLQGIQQNKEPLMEAMIGIIESILNLYAEVLPAFLETGLQLVTQLMFGMAEAMPAFVETVQGMIESVFTSIIDNLPMLLESGILLVTSIIQGIVETVPLLMQMGMELLLTLATAIVDNIPLIIESAASIMKSFMSSIKETLPRLLEIALELVHTIIDGINNNVDLLVESAIAVIQSISDFLINNLPTILEAALEIILAVIEGLISNVDKLIEGAVQIINSIAEFMIDNLPTVIDAALQIILAIMDGLLDNIDSVIQATITIMVALVEAVISRLPEVLNSALQIIISLANGLLNNMPQVVTAIMQVITGLIGAVVRMLPQILILGVQLVGELAIGITKSVGTVITAGINIIKSIFSAMKASLSGAVQIGTDLVKGIWNGINNATGWIMDKIKGFGTSVMNGIKGVFGIKSPSRIMRDEVGIMIGKGLAIGIDKSKKEVDDSAKRMAKSALDIAKKMNTDIKSATNKHNAEIKQIEKRAAEDIHLIRAKAKKAKRKLTANEQVRIRRITEDANKKIANIEEKAAKERIKLSQENSKQLIEVSTKFVEDKRAIGQMSLRDEAEFWLQISLLVKKNSEEYQTALKNHQNVVKQIHSELTKINEDYAKRINDIDKKLLEDTKKLNEEYAKAYEDRVKDLTNVAGLFDAFVEKEQVSGQQLINNLVSQVVALSEYGAVMENLGDRISNTNLIGELQQLGPKSIMELKALLSMTDEELNSFVALYERRFELATEQANKELEPLKKDVEDKIKDLNGAAQVQLDILDREWQASIHNLVNGTQKELNTLYDVGIDAMKGLEQGMLVMAPALMEVAKGIADSIRTTIQSALDINSPSRVMRDEVGKNITLGIGEGMKEEMPNLQKDINNEMKSLTAKMKSTVDFETSSNAKAMLGGRGYSRGSEVVTNNNDNGITQNVTIVSPENTPSENARQLKKAGRDLALGY